MTRKPDHCGRCAAQGRRRSEEIRRETGRYACVECSKLEDDEVAQVREDRLRALESSNRRPCRCGRCGKQGRRRSDVIKYRTGVYACKSCVGLSELEAFLRKEARIGSGCHIIAYWPTLQFENADAFHPLLLQLHKGPSGSFTIVGCRTEPFMSCYKAREIRFVDVDWLSYHYDIIANEIENTSLVIPLILFNDSLRLTEVVANRQARTNQKAIIVTNNNHHENEWNRIRNVITVRPHIFRKHPRFWNHERHTGAPADGE